MMENTVKLELKKYCTRLGFLTRSDKSEESVMEYCARSFKGFEDLHRGKKKS